jgi:hypothetical protein
MIRIADRPVIEFREKYFIARGNAYSGVYVLMRGLEYRTQGESYRRLWPTFPILVSFTETFGLKKTLVKAMQAFRLISRDE